MSSKSVSTRYRTNIVSAGELTPVMNGRSRLTPSGLRHRPVHKSESAQKNHLEDKCGTKSGLFNKVLSTDTSSSTPRNTPRSTAINACYTPSSLFRNVMSTPLNKVRTQYSTASASKSKLRNTESASTSQIVDDTEISNLTVAVRVRPLNAQECSLAKVTNVVRVCGNELTVSAGMTADCTAGLTHSFTYDHVFDSTDPDSKLYANQDDVFAGTSIPLIDRAFQGYNACLFAYGQTGSGKSYSMMGIEALDDDASGNSVPHPEAGIIPRFCRELFKRLESMKHSIRAEIEISYFEIYNEKIHDLLCVAQSESNCSLGNIHVASTPTSTNNVNNRPALKVREHPIWGPYVVDLSIHPVDSYEAMRNWLAVGNSQRATAATGMNDKSSRSHSIFNIVLNLTEINEDLSNNKPDDSGTRQTRRSRISLVDLAGSERISMVGSNGDRIREGVSINKSLLTLGKVIAALADSKKSATNGSVFVPYRESVLTWLLRENLGGNSKTVMLATISPANINIDETLATLRYACQARTIVNRVKVNESPHDKIIRELRAEVDRLKSLRNEYERQRRLSANSNPTPRKIIIETSVDESEVDALRQQLAERERELDKAQKSWMQRLKEAEDQRKSELRLLRRKGLALELSTDQKHACLVNLTADAIFSNTLFYILPEGQVKIGRTRTSSYCSQPDILLDGPLVAYHHCIIENKHGELFIIPQNEDFETYLNGDLVTERKKIFHGDRLVIGGTHYFRISNPFCSQRNKKLVVDFQMAHEEILHKQEEKLRRELEEEKRAALSRIEFERAENERNFNERMQKLELEQLKYKCNREILETERKAFQEEAQNNTNQTPVITPYTPTFKSNLLDDINNIMQNPSDKSLHKTQLMVKEATQRCRSLGMQIEFRHSQVLDEFGIFHTVVLLHDKPLQRKAEWPIARLSVWLDMVRNNDDLTSDNLFNCVDMNWEPMESDDCATLNDSLNSSRISLNLSVVKDALLKKPINKLHLFNTSSHSPSPIKASSLISDECYVQSSLPGRFITKKVLQYDDCIDSSARNTQNISENFTTNNTTSNSNNLRSDFNTLALMHLRDMERSTSRLRLLCNRFNNEQENLPNEISSEEQQRFRESLIEIEKIMHGMRTYLDRSEHVEGGEVAATKMPKAVRFLID
ncbi:kinesin-like protein KIF14 [Zeugodacus cucurbitae]|uniref:Kinesin-like protein KIF14 n=1 Tax=Zeugodacus cucurbitae TaxID=28588 RepID=A0A0A1X961_ZEUCU|nr:kinesin-like protein KIF14 [Zeugodacus cucurbitae]